MKTALFLGAGASVFASQPTTKKIMTLVRERVQKRADEPNRDAARQSYIMNLVSDEIYGDVEKLYDGLERAINTDHDNCKPIIRNTREGAYDLSHEQIIDELLHLKSIIREILLTSLVIRSDVYKSIKQVYDVVWEAVKDNGTDEFQVFTTNYDTIIEEYCEEATLDMVNGFESYRKLRRTWDDKWTSDTTNALYLTKLHGSINWYKNADNKIVEIGDIGQRDGRNDIMIAPTEGTKQYNKEPFSTLMERFRTEIEKVDVLLVIGFSYRDEEIVNVIKNRIRDGMTLISISPDAVEDIHRVTNLDVGNLKMYGQQLKLAGMKIVLYEQEFGPDTIDNIRAALGAAYKHIRNNRIRLVQRKLARDIITSRSGTTKRNLDTSTSSKISKGSISRGKRGI